MNSGLHDAVNLASALLGQEHEKDEYLLERYTRQRRHVAVTHVQTATMADKKNLEQRDPEKRRLYFDQLRATASDPAAARQYMMRASLIESLRDAAQIA